MLSGLALGMYLSWLSGALHVRDILNKRTVTWRVVCFYFLTKIFAPVLVDDLNSGNVRSLGFNANTFKIGAACSWFEQLPVWEFAFGFTQLKTALGQECCKVFWDVDFGGKC